MKKILVRDADQPMANHAAFDAGSLQGHRGAVSPTFALTGDHKGLYRRHAELGLTVYTVTSYGTPIAWVLKSGKVIIPSVTYSRTTTQHQYAAVAAMTNNGT